MGRKAAVGGLLRRKVKKQFSAKEAQRTAQKTAREARRSNLDRFVIQAMREIEAEDRAEAMGEGSGSGAFGGGPRHAPKTEWRPRPGGAARQPSRGGGNRPGRR